MNIFELLNFVFVVIVSVAIGKSLVGKIGGWVWIVAPIAGFCLVRLFWLILAKLPLPSRKKRKPDNQSSSTGK
jgi:hypothetical protein